MLGVVIIYICCCFCCCCFCCCWRWRCRHRYGCCRRDISSHLTRMQKLPPAEPAFSS